MAKKQRCPLLSAAAAAMGAKGGAASAGKPRKMTDSWRAALAANAAKGRKVWESMAPKKRKRKETEK